MIRSTMALRNTLRQPRRSALLGGAIAFGVIVICLSTGLTAGMEKAVQANVTLFSAGHILINGFGTSESGRSLNRIEDQALAAKTKQILPEALSVSPTAQAQATVVFGSREQQLKVRGVDWNSDRLFSGSLVLNLGDWASAKADRAIVMGASSARRFGLGLGDSVLVRLSTVSGQQNVTEYNLAAVYDDAAAGGMTTVFVPLANLLADLNLKEGQYQSLAVFLPDAAAADAAGKKLVERLGVEGYVFRTASASSPTSSGTRPGEVFYRMATVTELSGQMGAVLGSVRWIGATIFAIMLLLVMAGITNTYRMVLMERTKEIGMLRCIGFRRKDIFRIFIYEALLIAMAGSLAGVLASMPLGLLAHLIPFDPAGSLGSALSRGRLLFSPDILSLAFVSLCVMAASAIAVSGPALRASKLLPIEALRVTA